MTEPLMVRAFDSIKRKSEANSEDRFRFKKVVPKVSLSSRSMANPLIRSCKFSNSTPMGPSGVVLTGTSRDDRIPHCAGSPDGGLDITGEHEPLGHEVA